MIIVICGPTGVGKTKLSIKLAKYYNAEVINCDATSIYKGLDIGSAKVTKEEMDGVIHHMIDIKRPDEIYNVYEFQKEVRNILDNNKDKNYILCGGTGLYINACLYDYRFNSSSDNTLNNLSNEQLYDIVKNKYNNNSININNRQRMISFINSSKSNYGKNILYDHIVIGLTTNRDNLYNIINNRVDIMINNNLIDEVKDLYNKYPNSNILKCAIGYKEIISYLNNDITKEEAIGLIKKNSRNYAKRQYTWFNNKLNVNYFNVDYNNFDNTVNEVIEFINKKAR